MSLFSLCFILALAPRASAQVNAGETSLNLNGTVSAGYSDDYSNVAGSDHSIVGAGTADLSGSYYNPNFLSFDIQPFYNQSRLNSTFQSLTAASGVNASAKIFGGSHFPGSISYSTSSTAAGTLMFRASPTTPRMGTTMCWPLTWGVHLEDLPSLNFSFSDANSAYSVYGANAQGTLHC